MLTTDTTTATDADNSVATASRDRYHALGRLGGWLHCYVAACAHEALVAVAVVWHLR